MLWSCFDWLTVLIAFRYISLTHPLLFVPLSCCWRCRVAEWVGHIHTVVTIFRHRSNIERLRRGTEFRAGQRVER